MAGRGAPKGLKEKFDDRVLGTPISEAAFTGLGGGLALDGRYYPVVELMYADFIWVAADQLFNQIGKARHMFGGDHDMPLLLRIKVGTGTGYGSQHSMDPAGIRDVSRLAHRRAVDPLDYVGLVNAAMALKDPVAVLEHDADLYKVTGPAPKQDFDFVLPPGQAAVRGPARGDRPDVSVDGPQIARGRREVRRGRRCHRPALARPGQHRLGRHRVEHQEDEQGGDRRAGLAGHVLWRLAGRRDPAPVLRLARRPGCTGRRQRVVAEHLQALESAAVAGVDEIVEALQPL